RGPLFLPELRHIPPPNTPLMITSQHPPRIVIQTLKRSWNGRDHRIGADHLAVIQCRRPARRDLRGDRRRPALAVFRDPFEHRRPAHAEYFPDARGEDIVLVHLDRGEALSAGSPPALLCFS